MTIITKPISGQKKPQDEVLIFVPSNGPRGSLPVPPSGPNDEDDHVRTARNRRTSFLLTQSCLMVTVLLALCVGLIGVVHLMRQMRGPQYYRGVCRMPYSAAATISADSMISGKFGNENLVHEVKGLQPVIDTELTGEELQLTEKLAEDGTLELDYELDLEFEEFEAFEFPEISHGRYIHDFKFNKTAIIDPDGGRCFVMELDRNEIPRPKTLFEVIRNMKNGVYDLDIEEVRHDTRVVLPQITDVSQLGLFINSACDDKNTFMLEKVIIMKRSVEEVSQNEKFQFMEIAGKKVIKYNIMNLADI